MCKGVVKSSEGALLLFVKREYGLVLLAFDCFSNHRRDIRDQELDDGLEHEHDVLKQQDESHLSQRNLIEKQ